jgi:integrase
VESHEVLVLREGRTVREVRETRHDTITTEDVDDFRRELLEGRLSPRSIQKILVLLHGVFKLAKRRKMIEANPSADAERLTLEDPGTFNILEPAEFEALYLAVLGDLDKRRAADRRPDTIDDLPHDRRSVLAVMLSTAFYAGVRMGELRDLSWRNVDFTRSMIRVESGIARGERTSPKGKRARSIPLVSVLAERLMPLADRQRFTAGHDYVFCNDMGERVGERALRAVFYDALARARFADKRSPRDPHGNAQSPIRVHDLRHSFCTWAVNVWPITHVQSYAGHRDIKTTMRYVHHQTKTDDARLAGAYLERALDVA